MLTHGLFSTMGQISTLQLLHIIKLMTPISQFVLNSTTTRPSIFVQKKEKKYQKKEKKIRACFMKKKKKNPHQSICSKRKLRKKLRKRKEKDLFRTSTNTYIYNSFSTMCLFSQEYIVTLLKQGLV